MSRLVRAFLLALLLPAGTGDTAAQAVRPPQLEGVDIEQHLGAALPADLPFRDESGQTVHLADYLGKRPLVLTLIYYECPMLCTQVGNGLVSSLDVLPFQAGSDFDVVAVSFDPGETPDLAKAKKRSYLERYGRPGTEDGWHFLTGDEPSIRALADAVGFRYRYDPETDLYAHVAAIYVVTPDGHMARYFFGVDYPPRDLRLALVEASKGTIGTVVDQVLLFCYRYDPATGKYSASILAAVRIGGALTLLAIAAFFLLVRRRARRTQHKVGS